LRARVAVAAVKKRRARETLAHMQARRSTRGGLTVIELAAETGWSARTLHRMFANEPDVSRMVNPETMHRREYECIRIPRSVADRVLARYAKK
jgi:AraC-like DNA-binding protein